MTAQKRLLEVIKGREGSGRFGYGIVTADRYVQDVLSAVGLGVAAKHFHCIGNGAENLIKRAAGTLTFCGENTETEACEKLVETNMVAMEKLLGGKAPAHAMMAIVNRLTTPREDRDGDTLQTKGASLDPKAPLLWQHVHTLPLGKMMRIIEQNDTLLKVATVLLDINELTSDAAKLVEAGVLRFSHGFIPMKFEERKGGPMARFNILEYDIVEESLVSVPSNVDAEIELFARGKLASEPFKSHAKHFFDARKKSMPVTEKAKAIFDKGSPDQPRDENGRFAGTGGSSPDRGDGSGATGSGGGKPVASADSGDVAKSLRSEKVREVMNKAKLGDTFHGVEVGGGDIIGEISGQTYDDEDASHLDYLTIDKDGEYHEVSPSSKWSSVAIYRYSKSQKFIRKMFDVATERLEPCTQEQDWAARYIGCAVKDMVSHETGASGMMIGAFLTALDVVASKYKVTDTRNMKGSGSEAPPVHEVIETKSDERKTFLVEGIRFGTASDHRIVWRLWQGWGGQRLLVYADNDKHAQGLIDEVWDWVQKNNPLKGQAFALAGGWISKTGTAWEDVFLEKDVEAALKRTVRIVNDKGADAANRGLVLAGPPGTGKTLSARVMLNEADATFIWVSAKDFWKLGSYVAFAGAFSLARELAPSIICFEDVDNWIDSYTVDLLKGEMDGLQQSTGVTTLLTTNFPDQLPAALIDRPGRFHDVLEIHLPTREVRVRMLQKWAMGGLEGGATLDAIAKMADDTDGYSGAHMYELCHFAKTIKDEDDCSLDDALTKAFAKVKEQRDLINQNQLAGSSYRPGRRELESAMSKGWRGNQTMNTKSSDGAITGGQIGPTPKTGEDQQTFMERCMLDPTMMGDYPTEGDRTAACKVQWGKGTTPETKDDKKMGECNGCGKKMDLDKDGYCKGCAEEMTDDEDGRPGKPKQPKSGKPNTSKSGRVLSQRNFDALGDVMADLKEAADMDGTPRAAKALIRSGMSKIKSVLDAATPETPDDVTPKAPTDEDVLHAAVLLAATNRGARDHLKELIETLNLGDEHVQIAEDYAALTTSTG